jgi:hypothetical protein
LIRRFLCADAAGVRDSDDTNFKCIETCEKWVEVRRNLSKNKDEEYNPDAPAAATSTGRPELGQKKLKELKKTGHPADRLQASFDKCWADARAHTAGRDTKYDARWKEMLANQGAWITLLKTTSAVKKRNTNLAFLIGGNDAAMDEETRAWYNAHRQEILRPPSTASASPLTTSTLAANDASPPEAQEGTADEPIVV